MCPGLVCPEPFAPDTDHVSALEIAVSTGMVGYPEEFLKTPNRRNAESQAEFIPFVFVVIGLRCALIA